MKSMEVSPKRPYRMQARAQAAAATGERILDAAVAVFWQRPVDEIPLEEVARRAGVSLQTVIRRFGGKQGLFAAAAQRETERVRRQRDQAPVGDVRRAVRNLLDHYEELGVRCCACWRRRTARRRCGRWPTRDAPTTRRGASGCSHQPWPAFGT
jgi:AcrR family transcriptional regulator